MPSGLEDDRRSQTTIAPRIDCCRLTMASSDSDLDCGPFGYEKLLQVAQQAVDNAQVSQSELARQLDVHRSTVSRALSEGGPKFQDLQRRIIDRLTPYRVQRRVTFQLEAHGGVGGADRAENTDG